MSFKNYYSHDPARCVQSVADAVAYLRPDRDCSDKSNAHTLVVLGTNGQPVWLGPGFVLPYFPAATPPGERSRHRYLADRPFSLRSSQSDGSGQTVGTPETVRLEGRVRLSTRLPHWDEDTTARTNSHGDIAQALRSRGVFIPPMYQLHLRSEWNTVTVYQLFEGSLPHRLLSPDVNDSVEDMWFVAQVDEDGRPPLIRDGSGLPLRDFAREARPAFGSSFHRAQPLPEFALVATKYQCFLNEFNVELWYDKVTTVTDEDEKV